MNSIMLIHRLFGTVSKVMRVIQFEAKGSQIWIKKIIASLRLRQILATRLNWTFWAYARTRYMMICNEEFAGQELFILKYLPILTLVGRYNAQ
ncbi:MAG: hypothetical protein IIC76_05790 [Bacteroidetes bacterium]|nr:hypothetical protein [Bacteroidota bacterium]